MEQSGDRAVLLMEQRPSGQVLWTHRRDRGNPLFQQRAYARLCALRLPVSASYRWQSFAHAYCNTDHHAKRHSNGNTDTDSKSDKDSIANCYAYADANTDTNPNIDFNAYTNATAHCVSDRNAHPDCDSHGYAYTHAGPNHAQCAWLQSA